jgi:hypothetical protein
MKTSRILLCLLLPVAVGVRLAAFDKNGPHVEVNFFEPAQFTDVRDSYPEGTESGREATLAELRSHLVRRLAKVIPAGQKLSVTITDVDLAGDFEPWHGPQWDSVRVVKDIYPPTIKLDVLLVDEQGNVLKSGKRELRDLAFLMKLTMGFRDDPLRHEKALLDDWIGQEFRETKRH